MDFAAEFWHCECVCGLGESAFAQAYRVWCEQYKYRFNQDKAHVVYEQSQGRAATLPKDAHTEFHIKDIAKRITALSQGEELYRAEMLRLAQRLPEYPAVARMFGMGKTFGALLMAEVGDVRRFSHKRKLVAFAGIDPGRKQSGKHDASSVPISRNGSERLRSVLHNVVVRYVRAKPKNEPVYQFYLKKRGEGKAFYVCIVAAANKFLRVYYARVKEYVDGLGW